jgi:hypothetical protein
MALERGLRVEARVGTALAISISKPLIHRHWRTTMKFETVMLQTFFAAAVLTCLLTFGAMVTTTAPVGAPVTVAAR